MKKKIKILYEDDDVLAIDKPAGIAVHDDADGNQKYTIVDWILENYPKMKKVYEDSEEEGSNISRPGIVHRLDKDTSGVLLLAKNIRAYRFLKKQFKDKTIKKVYRAIIYGDLKKDVGIIDRPIGRSKDEFRSRATGSLARGEMREAITYYRVVERFKDYSLLELRPRTGRTHQLRVHLKSVSHPIVCDAVYAKGQPCLPGLKRHALHAFSVEFKLPSDQGGKEIKVESPLPADFKKALVNLRPL
ncbi:MAG: RluA family pseudouridine synthase [bacterium]|nr:RluA family pseudouridine synthase [bacterium]